jgi:hypothetical protein
MIRKAAKQKEEASTPSPQSPQTSSSVPEANVPQVTTPTAPSTIAPSETFKKLTTQSLPKTPEQEAHQKYLAQAVFAKTVGLSADKGGTGFAKLEGLQNLVKARRTIPLGTPERAQVEQETFNLTTQIADDVLKAEIASRKASGSSILGGSYGAWGTAKVGAQAIEQDKSILDTWNRRVDNYFKNLPNRSLYEQQNPDPKMVKVSSAEELYMLQNYENVLARVVGNLDIFESQEDQQRIQAEKSKVAQQTALNKAIKAK